MHLIIIMMLQWPCRYNSQFLMSPYLAVLDTYWRDGAGLFSVDILDPDIYVPLSVLYYFRTGISSLQTLSYVPAKSLFGFGFDFRRVPT